MNTQGTDGKSRGGPQQRPQNREQELRPLGQCRAANMTQREIDLNKVELGILTADGQARRAKGDETLKDGEVPCVIGLVFGEHDPYVVEHIDTRKASVESVNQLIAARQARVSFDLAKANLPPGREDVLDDDIREAEEIICEAERDIPEVIGRIAGIRMSQRRNKRILVVFSDTDWDSTHSMPDLSYDVVGIHWPEYLRGGAEIMTRMRDSSSDGVLGYFIGFQSQILVFAAISGSGSKFRVQRQFSFGTLNHRKIWHLEAVADGAIATAETDLEFVATRSTRQTGEDESVGAGTMAAALAPMVGMLNGGATGEADQTVETPAPKAEPKTAKPARKKPARKKPGDTTADNAAEPVASEEPVTPTPQGDEAVETPPPMRAIIGPQCPDR